MVDDVLKVLVLLYADDSVILDESEEGIRNALFEIVEECKYLEVTMNHNGNLRLCQDRLCQQGRRAMYSLTAKSRKFDLPIDLQLELFDTMVLPIITYDCEVWGFKIINDV